MFGATYTHKGWQADLRNLLIYSTCSSMLLLHVKVWWDLFLETCLSTIGAPRGSCSAQKRANGGSASTQWCWWPVHTRDNNISSTSAVAWTFLAPPPTQQYCTGGYCQAEVFCNEKINVALEIRYDSYKVLYKVSIEKPSICHTVNPATEYLGLRIHAKKRLQAESPRF